MVKIKKRKPPTKNLFREASTDTNKTTYTRDKKNDAVQWKQKQEKKLLMTHYTSLRRRQEGGRVSIENRRRYILCKRLRNSTAL